jgi:hypothetical protein
MVRIVISVEAFEAIARTLPLGSVGYENKTNELSGKARQPPAPAACAPCVSRAGGRPLLGRRSGRRQDDARSDR